METGEPHAYMFYTSYRLPPGKARRPVTFIWNGGPGADSALLHFSVAGPKLVRGARLTDNAQSWLAVSDLVFVDPVGTGFSRPASERYAAEFYSTRGDVASVAEFVRCWRLLHGAQDAPVFRRAKAGVRDALRASPTRSRARAIRVDGLVLIGQLGLNAEFGSATLRDALRVVDMASTALYYGRLAPEFGHDANSVRQAAEAWVRNSYAPASSTSHRSARLSVTRWRLNWRTSRASRLTKLTVRRCVSRTVSPALCSSLTNTGNRICLICASANRTTLQSARR